MNRVSSVIQLPNPNESSNTLTSPSNSDMSTSLTSKSNSVTLEPSSYSHLFKGKHVSTMRKVSTNADLPKDEEHQETKTTLIYVQPIQ